MGKGDIKSSLIDVSINKLPLEEISLLRVIAEELKLPLQQVARSSELVKLKPELALEYLPIIEHSTDIAISLIDSYLLGLKLASQQVLDLEPLSLTSVAYDVANDLSKLAKLYDTSIELHIETNPKPVIGNSDAIRAALTSIGEVIIESSVREPSNHIDLSIHRSDQLEAVGIYSNLGSINNSNLRAAFKLVTSARQPFSNLSEKGVAGIFIAQKILLAMSSSLKVMRHHHMPGLGVTFLPSRQLTLI